MDAATGADLAGPALPVVTGPAVRALGWSGSTLVVVQYEAETDLPSFFDETGATETRHVRVLGLQSGAEPQVLLDPPGMSPPSTSRSS
ncbi:hypothetical protein ACFPIJ_45340 [Dactylosporangium cerinum]|uniref:Uncharacterized protein n=1 Tax=Dactylosporangium cerinum TaxID=1434730 RepID=A0ABV9W9L5_9ACTN